jgi:hypothetical protein
MTNDYTITDVPLKHKIDTWKDCINGLEPDRGKGWMTLRQLTDTLVEALSGEELRVNQPMRQEAKELTKGRTIYGNCAHITFKCFDQEFETAEDLTNFICQSKQLVETSQAGEWGVIYHYTVMMFTSRFFIDLLSKNSEDTAMDNLQKCMKQESLNMHIATYENMEFVVVMPENVPYDDFDEGFDLGDHHSLNQGMIMGNFFHTREVSIGDFLGNFKCGLKKALGDDYKLFNSKIINDWQIFNSNDVARQWSVFFGLVTDPFRSLFKQIGMSEKEIKQILPDEF